MNETIGRRENAMSSFSRHSFMASNPFREPEPFHNLSPGLHLLTLLDSLNAYLTGHLVTIPECCKKDMADIPQSLYEAMSN
jgi:hypothetical protein